MKEVIIMEKQLISNKDLVKIIEEQSELKADFYRY